MRALLDTDVISELRKPLPDPAVIAFSAAFPFADMHLSAVTISEIETGIANLRWRGDTARADELAEWRDALGETFGDRILPIDTKVAQAAGAMHAPNRRPVNDAYIAATAMTNGLTLVTRNTKEFQGLVLLTVDPWRWGT